MRVKPIRDQVLIQPVPPPPMSTVLEVVTGRRAETRGTVIGVGPDVREVTLGDRVLFAETAGQEVVVLDRTYLLMPEADVLAVCVPESDVSDTPVDVEGEPI